MSSSSPFYADAATPFVWADVSDGAVAHAALDVPRLAAAVPYRPVTLPAWLLAINNYGEFDSQHLRFKYRSKTSNKTINLIFQIAQWVADSAQFQSAIQIPILHTVLRNTT